MESAQSATVASSSVAVFRATAQITETCHSPSSFTEIITDKIEELCHLLVETYYWKRLADLKSTLEQVDTTDNNNDEVDDNDQQFALIGTSNPDLVEYFRQPASGLIMYDHYQHEEDEENEESSRQQKASAEYAFKVMLLHLVGELMVDLYSDQLNYDTNKNRGDGDELENSELAYAWNVAFKTTTRRKKMHFKSILKGIEKINQLCHYF